MCQDKERSSIFYEPTGNEIRRRGSGSAPPPGPLPNVDRLKITELIGRAPWREAVTYRNTWPHEYVLSRKDGQRKLIELVCARFRAGEGVVGTFFGGSNTYLFIGDYKYWLMTH